MYRIPLIALLALQLSSCNSDRQPAPEPVYPIPSERQLAWQDLEYYGFVHFNMNTFTNMEWGTGAEDPSLFNPTEFDAGQWARVVKDAGMKGIIITAKHHDGFCLWPTTTTEHSIKASPYKGGKGDIIQEIAEACRAAGLKFGVYLSPWDRNNEHYGTAAYIDVFREQLRELLTNYGEVFEVWFDGANGGTGYYGGANEERRVDKKSYYDWENTFKIIRELQPNAVIFGDAGPDVRWVGNEHGFAYETTWSNLMRDSVYGGMPEYSEMYSPGQENGTHWVPAEADVSIRPGWYYHEYEDHKVKTLPQLLDIYYNSIGRNASLLLNFPVDKRGLIHENDVAQLQKLTAKINEDFANNLVGKQVLVSTSVDRGRSYSGSKAIDGKSDTFWSTPDGEVSGSLTLEFKEEISFNRFMAQEYIPLGQRVKAFVLEAQVDGEWQEVARGTTVGYKRILRLPSVKTKALRFTVLDAKASPTISNLALFDAPKLLIEPVMQREKSGLVSFSSPDDEVVIYYTLDGSQPTAESLKYQEPIMVSEPSELRVVSLDPQSGQSSEVAVFALDIPKANWKVVGGSENAIQAIDENDRTNYTADSNRLMVDMGSTYPLSGFTYMPVQNRYMSGVIKTFVFEVSRDGVSWQQVAEGEFGNIANSPILQRVSFSPTDARFFRFSATETLDGNPASFAEVGVITVK
ncbi:MAG: alpha-L-fucosidase [Lunatimonas sp.]|uniref:alpha-L-fucosidase n=1 Tax=Lunatimonas sp. TaxID=2060141 RepID=UPI00263BDEE9|nr:alpha-L-fucosidase [Lunatimonas sp.]MCC5939235.1 alpha-L-fucosidase [Lunatimonas sp.]